MADTGNEDRVQKMEVDYSSAVEEKIPKCEKLAKVNYYLLFKAALSYTHNKILSKALCVFKFRLSFFFCKKAGWGREVDDETRNCDKYHSHTFVSLS